MSKGLRIFLWIVGVIAALGLIGFIVWKAWGEEYAKKVWDNITFGKPVPESLDLQGVTLADLQAIALGGGSSKTILLTLGMDIENKNNFDIPFSARFKSSYGGNPVAETAIISGTVPKNDTLHVSTPVTLTISGTQAQILIDKLQNKKPVIDYSITDLFVFHVPVSWFVGPITNTFQL